MASLCVAGVPAQLELPPVCEAAAVLNRALPSSCDFKRGTLRPVLCREHRGSQTGGKYQLKTCGEAGNSPDTIGRNLSPGLAAHPLARHYRPAHSREPQTCWSPSGSRSALLAPPQRSDRVGRSCSARKSGSQDVCSSLKESVYLKHPPQWMDPVCHSQTLSIPRWNAPGLGVRYCQTSFGSLSKCFKERLGGTEGTGVADHVANAKGPQSIKCNSHWAAARGGTDSLPP